MTDFYTPRTLLNKHSDITAKIRFVDESGNVIPIPSYDWDIKFFTDLGHASVSSNVNGALSKCRASGRDLYCFIPADSLSVGVIKVEHVLHIPSSDFPDLVNDFARNYETEYEVSEYQDTIPVKFVQGNIFSLDLQLVLSTESGVVLMTEDGKVFDLNKSFTK